MWRNNSKLITPRGLTTENVNGLAGLASARRIHEGQFFTPEPLAHFVWNLVAPSLDMLWIDHKQKAALLDNSIGSGRLFEFADPKRHMLFGVDTDVRCIEALARTLGMRIVSLFHFLSFICLFHSDAQS